MNRREFIKNVGLLTTSSIIIPNQLFSSNLEEEILTGENYNSLTKNELIDLVYYKFLKSIKYIGHGNFNKSSFDEVNKIAKFDKHEVEFLENLFYTPAKKFGFMDEKVITEIDFVMPKELEYIREAGHYLREDITPKFNEMVKEAKKINPNLEIVLTSGIRNIPKQMFLFLNKTKKVNYDLNIAAHSLAPPGYSFHGKSDFDIGKKGFGINNFTNEFAKTEEFKVLTQLGYLKLRYTQDNELGVRYEPWHVKMS